MKTVLQILIVLSLFIYTIPIEEWDQLSKSGKAERLQKGIDVIKQELGCTKPSIELDIDGKYLYMYGECDKGTFVALNKQGGEL